MSKMVYAKLSQAETIEKDGKLCVTVQFQLVSDSPQTGFEQSSDRGAIFRGRRNLRQNIYPNLSPCRR